MDGDGFVDDLRACGVTETTLGPRDREALDREGYLLVPGLLTDAELAGFRSVFADDAGRGTAHLANLVSRGPGFARLAAHPAVLAAVSHVLGRPFRLFQFSGRDPAPGFGLQGLHADWLPRTSAAEPYAVASVLWMLDAFSSDNGATRVVPGSHVRPGAVPRDFADPASRHPDERLVTGPAGAALVFNGHLWHAGSRNASASRRRTFQLQYAALDVAPRKDAPPEIPTEAGTAIRRVLEG